MITTEQQGRKGRDWQETEVPWNQVSVSHNMFIFSAKVKWASRGKSDIQRPVAREGRVRVREWVSNDVNLPIYLNCNRKRLCMQLEQYWTIFLVMTFFIFLCVIATNIFAALQKRPIQLGAFFHSIIVKNFFLLFLMCSFEGRPMATQYGFELPINFDFRPVIYWRT